MNRRLHVPAAVAAAVTLLLAGCGGDDDCIGNCGPGPGTTTSYVGTTGVMAAWADPSSLTLDAAPSGEYAGKRQLIRGTVSPYSGDDLGQPAGAEIYQFSDGNVHLLDLTFVGYPVAVQVSSESNATVDPACTTNGPGAVAGASTDYTGVFFAPDLAHPELSTYVYRLPGSDNQCNTTDDVVHAVRMGMSPTTAPLVATAMPAAAVYGADASLDGFVAKSGSTIVRLDANLGAPTTLATFSQPIQVLDAMPLGRETGYETGRLFIVDGDIVYIDYAAGTVSDALYTIPGWTATKDGLQAQAGSPTGNWFAIYTPGAGGAIGSTDLYRLPADGSAAPTLMATIAGKVVQMEFPVGGTSLVVGVQGAAAYSILAVPEAGGLPTTVLIGDGTTGRFTATADDVYFTEWTATTSGNTLTRSNQKSGISTLSGTVVMAPVANSLFMQGGEAVPWTNNDLQTQRTALATVFQVTGLTQTSTKTDSGSNLSVTAPSLTGGTLVAIDTTTNAPVATLGTFSPTSATMLEGTVHPSIGHWLFIEAGNPATTQDPSTRDLYLLNSHTNASLLRATANL